MKAEWKIKKLGELCRIRTGKKDVNQGNPDGAYPFFTCAAEHTFSDSYSFDTEALLIAGNGNVGQVSYYNGKFEAYQRTYVLSDFSEIHSRFLFQILDGKLKETVSKQKLGNTMPYIKLGMLSDFLVPIPPLDEQCRIVTVLDEVFVDIASARANVEKNRQNARELFETYLRNLLNSRTSDGIKTTLQKCCDQIFAGGDVPKDRVSNERTATYPVPIFSNGAKDDGLYGFTDTARVTKPSVTVSARGTLGFSAIRNEPFLPVVRLIVLTPNENLIDLSFLHYTVLGMDFENTGTSIPQLTVPNFKDLSIYLPPVAKQKELVFALDSMRDDIQNLESIYRQKLTALDALRKSLLHQAFSGQL